MNISRRFLRFDVILKSREAQRCESRLDRIRLLHPFVYDEEIANISEVNKYRDMKDAECRVLASSGEFISNGLFCRQSSISVRLLRDDFCATLNKILEQKKNTKQGRIVFGEADDLPGLVVDKFENVVVVRILSRTLETYEKNICDEILQTLDPESCVLYKILTKKEKLFDWGESFTVNYLRGQPKYARVYEFGNIFHTLLNPSLEADWKFRDYECREFVQNLCEGVRVLDILAQYGQFGIDLACPQSRERQNGSREILCLETNLEFSKVIDENIKRNPRAGPRVTNIHRKEILEELRKMGDSKMEFEIVIVNLRQSMTHYYRHRHGQFGKHVKPDMKGIEKLIKYASRLVPQQGYLVVTNLFLSNDEAHHGWNLIKEGLELSNRARTARMIFSSGATKNFYVNLVQTDLIYSRSFVVQL